MLSHTSLPKTRTAPSRVIIESISPNLDRGRYPAKRARGEWMIVKSVIVYDGHEAIKGDILFRHESEKDWSRSPLVHKGNDIWEGRFKTDRLGFYYYTI